ncbi:MAG: hypothetical protein CMJ64_15625 [Planctomycetaceae bacterium]|nr:hypothetical protein [Planctomycetaceae bacterium]
MLTLYGEQASFCDGLPRRSFLRAGFLGAAGLSLAEVLRLRATASESGAPLRKTSVIFVELAGGPTQFETYDPKPKAPIEYRGEFGVVQTNVPGVLFSELMVEQSKIADKLAIIRSVHHRHNSHDPSSHLSQTGYYKTGKKGGPNQSPCFGSAVAKLRGPNVPSLPAYVAVPSIMRNGQAAYLGQAFRPFETISDPNDAKFEVRNLQLAKNISLDRLGDRRELLSTLDARQRIRDLDGASDAVDDFSQQAFDLVNGSNAREAFDIAKEPEAVRDRYGRNTVGQSMLLARRLVEAGVTCVTVRCTGWDDHNKMAKGLKERGPNYDRGIAMLVEDLYDRGLEKDVLVVAMGEFGRTPRINKNAGRDHWGALMSVLLAGGGLQPGIIGASTPKGEVPADAPYRPENILAMIYRHFGIDPAHTFNDFSGRPRYLLEEREIVRELV